MLTETFIFQGITGTVQRINPRKAPIQRAQYLDALAKTYPEIARAAIDTVRSAHVSMARYNSIFEFVADTLCVKEIVGLPFDWPAPTDPPELIAAAYEYWLEDGAQEPSLFGTIRDISKRLEQPNGAAGAALEQLTAIERADPK